MHQRARVTQLTPVTSIVTGVPSGTVPVSPLQMPLPPTAIRNMSMMDDTIEDESEVQVIYPVRNRMPAPSSVQQAQQQQQQAQQQGNEAPTMTPTNHGQMTPQQLLHVAAEQHAASVAAKENSPKKEQALAALAKATAALVQTQKWGHADPRAARSTVHDEAEKLQALAALRAASAALVAPGVQPPAPAAAAAAEFSCTSLVPTATDAWCLATCGSSKGLSCPLAMCKCDGGEVLAETKLIDPTKMDGEMPVTEQPAVTSGVSELPLVTKGAPAKITCVSLVPNANDEWCQTVCGSGGRCPGNVCRCSHDGVPYDAGEQQQALPTHGKAPLERSASTPPVTHNGKPLPPADGPPLTHSPKLQHVGKGPHPGGSNPKYAPAYDFKHRHDAVALEASEALKMHTQYQSAYDALLTGSDGADPIAAATAATAPPTCCSSARPTLTPPCPAWRRRRARGAATAPSPSRPRSRAPSTTSSRVTARRLSPRSRRARCSSSRPTRPSPPRTTPGPRAASTTRRARTRPSSPRCRRRSLRAPRPRRRRTRRAPRSRRSPPRCAPPRR